MKSVGEVMAIGRTFKEALLKGVRALDTGKRVGSEKIEPRILMQRLVTPHPERLSYLRYALRQGYTVKQLQKQRRSIPGSSTSSKKLTTCSWSLRSIRWNRFPLKFCATRSAWDFPMGGWQVYGVSMAEVPRNRYVTSEKNLASSPFINV
jgi:hypothetical protein